jgi:HSP20 family molecular chaperone IbpA
MFNEYDDIRDELTRAYRNLMGDYEEESQEKDDVFVDIIEDRDEIIVTIPLPGKVKEEIGLWAKDLSLDIRAGDVHKHIVLPKSIDPDSTRATFKNGVLSVRMKKKE